jgi:anti-sigma factor RsiW
MTDYLSDAILNALADGELSPDQLSSANQHLGGCPSCTSKALYQSLLKSATAKAGQRYAPPPQMQGRLLRLASEADSPAGELRVTPAFRSRLRWGSGSMGWAAAALLLVVTVGMVFVQRAVHRAALASAEDAALTTEALDQHIATLAGNMPLEVVSTDRHTVKPWFQGKIPFSFNLPQGLAGDTTLDGADLTYLRNQPVAQLLYSIGKHRVSVFLWHPSGAERSRELREEHAGFHEMEFNAGDLAGVAVSDVEPTRLAELVAALRKAQTGDQKQTQ